MHRRFTIAGEPQQHRLVDGGDFIDDFGEMISTQVPGFEIRRLLQQRLRAVNAGQIAGVGDI